jgi:hypothetical protein
MAIAERVEIAPAKEAEYEYVLRLTAAEAGVVLTLTGNLIGSGPGRMAAGRVFHALYSKRGTDLQQRTPAARVTAFEGEYTFSDDTSN